MRTALGVYALSVARVAKGNGPSNRTAYPTDGMFNGLGRDRKLLNLDGQTTLNTAISNYMFNVSHFNRASLTKWSQECYDDRAEFYMTNGAAVHYYFAHADNNKDIRDALAFHDHLPLSYYDAVIANSGNTPTMSPDSVLSSAFELQQAAVSFFWLSSYDKTGDINGWEASNIASFHESGARYVDISAMTYGLRSMTKGAIEGTTTSQSYDDQFGDPHFCLPGPPDEMGLLLLKLVWAAHEETNG